MRALRQPFAQHREALLLAWAAMGKKWVVRRHADGRVYVDCGHDRRVWSFPVGTSDARIPLTEELAQRVLELVRMEVSRGKDLDDALAMFQPSTSAANRCETKLAKWLDAKRRETRSGDRSPTYLDELERYAKPGGHFSFWTGHSIAEGGDYAALEDWSAWLADRGLSPKSRYNVMAAWHSFLGWLYRRRELRELPRDYPWPKVPEHAAPVLSIATQRAVLEAIPVEARGVFLALALLGLRPGEAVALRQSDLRDGWLTVARARKGSKLDAPVRGTKSGAAKRLPVPEELLEWLARTGARGGTALTGASLLNRTAPLFTNPATGGPWAKSALRRRWEAACAKVGVRIGLYNGTKHTLATEQIRRGTTERTLQAILGHADAKSTRRYARLADQAVVEALRR